MSSQTESKSLRAQRVIDSGALNEKRFSYPKDPEVRGRIRILYETVREFKAEYPEVISFTLFGSNTKGYATHQSDIDGFLLVDYDLALEKLEPKVKTEDIYYGTMISRKYLKLFSDKVLDKKELNILPEQLKTSIFAQAVSKDRIPRWLNDEFDVPVARHIAHLFLLPVGRLGNLESKTNLDDYRKKVLETLEQQGSEGERKWQIIMETLGNLEALRVNQTELLGPKTNPTRHKSIYPQNISEAKKYFLTKSS